MASAECFCFPTIPRDWLNDAYDPAGNLAYRTGAAVKRLFLKVMACALTVAVTGVVVLCGLLYVKHGSIAFRCGMLATAHDPYLDGSGRMIQECSWHLGNGTRTWGETYGFKVRRAYLSVEVKHLNPHLTRKEAKEDE
jgi:hypothetical protein